MGMVAAIIGARDETIAALRRDPPQVWRLVAPDDPEAYDRARRDAQPARPGLLRRLFGAPSPPPPAPAPAVVLSDGEGYVADLDKAWHGLHFLMTGDAEPAGSVLDFLVAGGVEIGDEEVGYGPARAFTAAEVREICMALTALTDDHLRQRFDAPGMDAREVYPEIWERDGEEGLTYLMEYVTVLRDALTGLQSRGYGMLVVLS